MKKRFNKGFTLIEIIIVIVIIGILATLSLPKITGQLESVKGGEAMAMLGTIKRSVDSCFDSAAALSACDTFAELGITNPAASTLFTYSSTVVDPLISINAVRGANYVCMSFNRTTLATTFSYSPAGNPYSSIVSKTGAMGVIAACGTPGTAMGV